MRLVFPQEVERVELELALTDARLLHPKKVERTALNLWKAPQQLTHSVKQASIRRSVSAANVKANALAVSLYLPAPKS